MKPHPPWALLLALPLLLPSPARGLGLVQAAPATLPDTLFPLRAESPPVLDGRLDEALWSKAPAVTGFRTWTPDFGHPMVGDTKVWAAFDASNLYFAFQAFDPDPAAIKAVLTDRDRIRRDDWVAINLDTFGDQQALYAFYVNPLGIQGDTRYAGGQEDPNVDLVWYSAGRISEEGYVVEIQIPLKSIRFTGEDTVRMGVIFERFISRNREGGTFPPLDPAQGESWLTQMMPLLYPALEGERVLEVLPAYTYTRREAAAGGRLVPEEDAGEVSFTAKYGITPDLILDGTYNPDFSQVEADASQVDVNLRYQLYFPEKRAFFREGAEHFAVGATGVSALDPVQSILYTRTVADPIAGLKLTGKVSPSDFLAVLYAVDELGASLSGDGASGGESGGGTAPGSRGPRYAHVPVLRYKRALSEDGYLGAIYTARESGEGYNRVGGLDGLLRLGGASTLSYHAMLSRIRSREAEETEDGGALGLHYLRSTRNLDVGFVGKHVSEGFASQTGFIWRTGILQFSARVRPKFYPRSAVVRRVDVEGFSGQTRDLPSGRWETFNQVLLHALVLDNLSVRAAYSSATEVYRGRTFETGGLVAAASGQLTPWLFASLSLRRAHAIYYSSEPFQGRSTRVNGALTLEPSDRLRADFSYTYVDFSRADGGERLYRYPIYWGRLTYQVNRFLFFRGLLEYNAFKQELLSDLLASFTYIPGTVLHLGYGSLRDRVRWDGAEYVEADGFLHTRRSFFFKVSYLWRR